MRWLAALILVLLLSLALTSTGLPTQAQCGTPPCDAPAARPPYAPGELLIRFRPAVPSQRAAEVLAAEGAAAERQIPALGVDVVRLPPGLSVEQAVRQFERRPEVDYAEPNYLLYAALVDDPGLANQWAPQKLDAPAAWAITSGNPGVVIAIVDSGIDYGHSELAPNIWTNPYEDAGDGVDDDGNGKIDDLHGWDFANNDADPMDDHSHGTHVAGIAAAIANDSPAGLVGICPACTLMPVKVLGADGSAPLDRVANGITYAADNGARVVNLSLGAAIGGATLQSAVDYAWSHGVVVVAAAGNDGADSLFYPAAYANALGVGATDANDEHSCFSNYGSGLVDVTAPGEWIYSTLPRSTAGEDQYGPYSGTSMATPHVSGLAGLLFSQDLSRTNAQVRALIEATTNDLGPVGADKYFGTGRINAYRALTAESSPTAPLPGLYSNAMTASAYANTRKLARDAQGILHLAWHSASGSQYQVLYATSGDGGTTWSPPQVVFDSTYETYHPALALDGTYVYIAFPSKHGGTRYKTFFTRKSLVGGAWSDAVPLAGDAYDAVRPDLFVDPTNGRLHLVAASFDNAQAVYYRSSPDQGSSWGPLRTVDPTTSATASNSRYATVHAHGENIYIAARTVARLYFTTYYVHTVRSTDGGATWFGQTKLASWQAFTSDEYGISLAGVGDRLYMVYDIGSGNGGGLYFRRWDGVAWSAFLQLETTGLWPTITQAEDGQAWMLWEDAGSLLMRRYTGSTWEPRETVLAANGLNKAYYPNLKLGTRGGRIEWVYASCNGAPYRLVVDGRTLDIQDDPPTATIVAPAAGSTVSGSVAVQISAADAEDLPGTLAVQWSVDGGPWQPTSYDGANGAYQATWDTTAVPDGGHSLAARATDSSGNVTGASPVSVTTENVNEPPTATIVAPAAGSTVSDFVAVQISAADAEDPPGTMAVQWSVDGGPWQPTAYDGASVYRATWDTTTVPDGGHSLDARATDSAGNTATASNAVTVSNNNPPVAGYTHTCTNLSCTFDGSGSTDGDGIIVSYAWDWGDGSTGSGVNPIHTYAAAGTYPVLLTVSDDDGATDTDSREVTVTSPPTTVHIGDLDGVKTTAKSKWTATVTIAVHSATHAPVDGATISGTWSGGVTGTSTCTTSAGRCQVSKGGIPAGVLSVLFGVDSISHSTMTYDPAANHDDERDSNGTTIAVPPPANQPPVAAFTYNCSNLVCTFDGSTSTDPDGTIVSHAWTLGDGGTASGVIVSHTYAAPGTYNVVLKVTDDDGATGSANSSVALGGGTATLYVANLVISGKTAGTARFATVVATIRDTAGSPVGGATVVGAWTGDYTGGASGMTGTDGTVTFTSGKVRKAGAAFTFSVNNVAKSGYVYDHTLNAATSVTISIP